MFARVDTFALEGLDARPVSVEVDIRPGLPAFAVVGLADKAVREARERVRAALLNSGFDFPLRRITANLAPASLRKVGPGFDLALAVGVLAASGQAPAPERGGQVVFGELSLDGTLRGCRGTLAVSEGARRRGFSTIVVAHECAAEAALVEGIAVAGAGDVRAVAELLDGGAVTRAPDGGALARGEVAQEGGHGAPDLSDVRGQDAAIHALEIAAAGGHNVLLEGPPGTGKTMLARCVPSILPPLTRAEALEVTRIHSVVGLHTGGGLLAARPFRAPHHTVSPSGMTGGGAPPRPGEATLAHRGVLFLDELSEFSRSALEALRQPLEDGRVAIVRGQRTIVFPTRFTLVAATNPCPCGYAGVGARCRCSEPDLARHRRRLSGPLLDRIDLRIAVARPTAAELAGPARRSSAEVRARVLEARERQAARLAAHRSACNAEMDASLVRRHVRLSDRAARVLHDAYEHGAMSARAHHRVLRVARTIADLGGHDRVGASDLLRALAMREPDGGERDVA